MGRAPIFTTIGTGAGAYFGGGLPGASVGGSIGASLDNFFQQQDTNDQNHVEAEINRGFQERMRSTAHQTEVADMQAAGINPILSAGGSGAAQPSGAQAVMQAPRIDWPQPFSGWVQAKQLDQKDEELKIAHANSIADIENKGSDTAVKKAEAILKQKGMIKAELEGEGARLLRQFMDSFKKRMNQNNPGQTKPELNQLFERVQP